MWKRALALGLLAVTLAGCGGSSDGIPSPVPATVASADCSAIADYTGSPIDLVGLVRGSLSGGLAVSKQRFPDLYHALQNLDTDLTASGGTATPLESQDLGTVMSWCAKVPGYTPPTT